MSIQRLVSVLFFSFYFIILSGNSIADNLGNFGSRIFQFQQKLANNGNKLAQYKLGTLYEFGISVKPNMEAAKEWYSKAAAQNYGPAVNRVTYLEVRQNGYNKQLHKPWFDKLNQQVTNGDPNAQILMGQMRRYGVVVKKDLKQAVTLLQKASSKGHTEVDSQIDELNAILYARQERRDKVAAEKKQADIKKSDAKKATKKTSKTKSVAKKKPKAKSSKSAAEKAAVNKASKEERRRRYEEAMRKMYQESLILEQQQEWAESAGDEDEEAE